MKRPELAAAPVAVSDRNAEAIFGVPWRVLRDWCAEHAIPVRRIGRRPVVLIADVVAALDGPVKTSWSEEDTRAAIVASARGRRS